MAAGKRLSGCATGRGLSARDTAIEDDHDPRSLHPARTIRVAIADGRCDDPGALAAAAFVDSIDAYLVPEPPAPRIWRREAGTCK